MNKIALFSIILGAFSIMRGMELEDASSWQGTTYTCKSQQLKKLSKGIYCPVPKDQLWEIPKDESLENSREKVFKIKTFYSYQGPEDDGEQHEDMLLAYLHRPEGGQHQDILDKLQDYISKHKDINAPVACLQIDAPLAYLPNQLLRPLLKVTPLQLAAMGRNFKAIMLLVQHGADTTAITIDVPYTPLVILQGIAREDAERHTRDELERTDRETIAKKELETVAEITQVWNTCVEQGEKLRNSTEEPLKPQQEELCPSGFALPTVSACILLLLLYFAIISPTIDKEL
jgi:hypothetical protein